jgi:hypothetical protein
MKYGYTCKCGWRLERGQRTRKQYAAEKEHHAFRSIESPREVEIVLIAAIEERKPGCLALRRELNESRAHNA